MQFQKIITRLAIILLIICGIILAVDLFKVLKINFSFMGMQSSERISSSSSVDSVRYEPTNYVIANKEEALEEIKKITLDLKNEYINSNKDENLFEIANINKIEKFFYEYSKYAVVKYKLLNIIEDLPKIHKATANYTDNQLTTYFNDNSTHIENYYGITSSGEFINLAKSLSFLGSGKIEVAILQDTTISFNYETDVLTFSMKMKAENGKSSNYLVTAKYYRSSDNQVAPYVSFTK